MARIVFCWITITIFKIWNEKKLFANIFKANQNIFMEVKTPDRLIHMNTIL